MGELNLNNIKYKLDIQLLIETFMTYFLNTVVYKPIKYCSGNVSLIPSSLLYLILL